ncbi:hypothetical protein SNE40_018795 [Patella caerulea]|uniref:Reverse transcriptase domain-containing protein n=1 Tax=Patella caerulea TaxID=87958 RepID=A0AAN8J5J3_PATCE
MDIKSAFRLLPIYPGDFDLLGFQFDNKYYIDKCLPMGCSISCSLFEKFSTFLHWVVEFKSGLDCLEHYLDDFIFIGGNISTCQKLISCFVDLCEEIGVPIAHEKTVGPVTTLTFLGLEIDTVKTVIRIPTNKTQNLISLLQLYSKRKKITLKNMQSLAGSLNFLCKAIRPGRAFIRRFYDAMIGIKKQFHFIRINDGLKQDMLIWLEFLTDFNGQVYFPELIWSSSEVLQLFTDSAGRYDLGCGAYLSGQWTYFQWPLCWKNSAIISDVTFLELVPIFIAISVWGEKLANKKITFNVDNMALVTILNKCTSKSKRIMQLLRPFLLYALKNNIIFRSRHLSSCSNAISDSISRKQWTRFRSLAPAADVNPQPIPDYTLNTIYNVK